MLLRIAENTKETHSYACSKTKLTVIIVISSTIRQELEQVVIGQTHAP